MIDRDGQSGQVNSGERGSAFYEVVDAYRSPVVTLAYRLTRNREEAKDIAQDVFLRAFKQLEMDGLDLDRNVAPWLYRVTRNAALDVLRSRYRAAARLEAVEALNHTPSAEDVALTKFDRNELRSAVRALPDGYRQVIELYYSDGLLYREVATALGMPIGTVKTRIARAKKRLRQIIEGERRKHSHAIDVSTHKNKNAAFGSR